MSSYGGQKKSAQQTKFMCLKLLSWVKGSKSEEKILAGTFTEVACEN